MYGMTSFDPVNAALQGSSQILRKRDEQALIENSSDLIWLYEGFQRFDVEREIARLFTQQDSIDTYRRMIDFRNITALVIDRVTTFGKDPVTVKWGDDQSNETWERIAHEDNEWDAWIQTLAKMAELLGTVVACATYDKDRETIELGFYTPNQIQVRRLDGDEACINDRFPNQYRVLLGDDQNRFQLWDFSTEPPTVSTSKDWTPGDDKSDLLIARDADGKPVVPFVPLRSAYASREYIVDKGQLEMLQAQRTVNILLTQVRVILHGGAFQVPVAEGPGWFQKGRNAATQKLLLDPLSVLTVPDDPVSSKATTLTWKGPANEAFIKAHYDAIENATVNAAASRGIDPSFLRASADARSGVSLFVGNQALNDKQKATRTLAQRPIERLVEVIRDTWNHFVDIIPDAQPFPVDAEFTVQIPEVAFAQEPKAKLEVDTGAVQAGFRRKRDVIREWNPGWTDKEIDDFIAESAPKPAAPVSLFGPRPAPPIQTPGSAGANSPQGPAVPMPGRMPNG